MPSFYSAIDRIAATSTMRRSACEELYEIDISCGHLLRVLDKWANDNLKKDQARARDWFGHVEPALGRLRASLKHVSE